MFQLGSRSDVTSSPTQIPLRAVVNIDITGSNACRNARILSIEIIFLLMKSGRLVDFNKRKKFFGVSGTLIIVDYEGIFIDIKNVRFSEYSALFPKVQRFTNQVRFRSDLIGRT